MAVNSAVLPEAGKRYQELEDGRRPFLERGREAAALTVPYLLPPSGYSATSKLTTPYQSLGARGARTLSSKLLLALFPQTPFFKYSVNEETLRALNTAVENTKTQMAQAGVDPSQGPQSQHRGEVDKALSARERAIMQELSLAVFRPTAFSALQHLIVAGNFCLYIPLDGGRSKGFRLDQYVVKRDPSGTVLEIIIKEAVASNVLSEQIKAAIGEKAPSNSKEGEDNSLDLYTHIKRVQEGDKPKWVVYQEINETVLPDSIGEYAIDACPFIVLRLSAQPGEDYGRGYVEEYLGDLDSLEGLTEAIVDASAASARTVFLVSPNGSTNIRAVQDAANLDIISGRSDDVSTLQVNKSGDLRVAHEYAQSLAQSLAYAFLMNTAIQRSGERVTAEEIRYLASELDAALGGVYTLLAAEFQLPVVRVFEKRMEKRTKAPPLPKDLVVPQIVTGLEAIGRGQDQRNMKQFVADILQTLGPQETLTYLNVGELIKRSAAGYSIDTDGLIKTDQEVQAAQQQAMQMQALQQLGPQSIAQMGGLVKQHMANQAAQQQQQPAQGTLPNG